MPVTETALIVINAQEGIRHRPYWSDEDVPKFLNRLQALVDGAQEQGIPVVEAFNVADEGPLALASGFVRTMDGLSLKSKAVFHKRSASALAGTGLDIWLVRNGIRKIIVAGMRTEQCCETTARHGRDIGFKVDYVTEATLTFQMTDRHGRIWTTNEIKERTELVLDQRFARIATVEEALELVPVLA